MNLEERRAIVHSDVLVGERRAIQHWQTASRSLRFHRLVPIVVFADACRYRFTMVICEGMAILAENSAYLSTGWWDASVAEERMPRSKLIRSQITRNLESCPDFQFRLTFIRKCEMRGLHPDDGRNHIYSSTRPLHQRRPSLPSPHYTIHFRHVRGPAFTTRWFTPRARHPKQRTRRPRTTEIQAARIGRGMAYVSVSSSCKLLLDGT